ncbi:hypothetical protein ACHAWF_001165 [Thalassiosira exigua]
MTAKTTTSTSRRRTIPTWTSCTRSTATATPPEGECRRTNTSRPRPRRKFRGTARSWRRADGPSASSAKRTSRRGEYGRARWRRSRGRTAGGTTWTAGGCPRRSSESNPISCFGHPACVDTAIIAGKLPYAVWGARANRLGGGPKPCVLKVFSATRKTPRSLGGMASQARGSRVASTQRDESEAAVDVPPSPWGAEPWTGGGNDHRMRTLVVMNDVTTT